MPCSSYRFGQHTQISFFVQSSVVAISCWFILIHGIEFYSCVHLWFRIVNFNKWPVSCFSSHFHVVSFITCRFLTIKIICSTPVWRLFQVFHRHQHAIHIIVVDALLFVSKNYDYLCHTHYFCLFILIWLAWFTVRCDIFCLLGIGTWSYMSYLSLVIRLLFSAIMVSSRSKFNRAIPPRLLRSSTRLDFKHLAIILIVLLKTTHTLG